MPAGRPRTLAERKRRHLRIYGTLKNFPKKPRGRRGARRRRKK